MKLQHHQQKHIEAWQSSGMSQAAYCREQSLNAKTFGNWLRAYRDGCAVNQPATLVPVTIKPTAPLILKITNERVFGGIVPLNFVQGD